MLKKDRKEASSELKALNDAEATAALVLKMTNSNESFIPKRRRSLADRLDNHALTAYEAVRYANHINPSSTTERKIRINSAMRAAHASLDLCSDIRLLSAALGIPKNDKRIEALTVSAVKTNEIVTRWYNSECVKYDNIKAEKKNETKKKK